MIGSVSILALVFLVISALCLTAMSLLRKEYDNRNTGDVAASFYFIALSYIFILVVAAVYFAVTGRFSVLAEIDGLTLLLGVGFAAATFITTIICIVGASYGSVSLLVVFANMGTVTLSVLYGLIFDPEKNQASLFTWIGLVLVLTVLALNFVWRDHTPAKNDTPRGKRIYTLLCFTVFFTNGIALVIYSMLTRFRPSVDYIGFISLYSVICVLAAVVCLAVLLLWRKRHIPTVKNRPYLNRASLILTGAYAVFFLAGEVLSLINTTKLPIIIQAPLSFAVPIFILALGERLIYKTPITKTLVIEGSIALLGSIFFVL